MAQRTVHDCDNCGTRNVTSPQQIHVTLSKRRVVAEDDTTYADTVDLCPVCCTRFLQQSVDGWSVEQREVWVKKVKSQ